MNSDLPNENDPREELEARVTALLLGELPELEVAELRAAIAQDPELAQLRERLARTIDLVREATQTSDELGKPQTAPLKLSAERREKLLAHFKTVVPREFAPKRKRELSWLLPVAAAILILLVGSFAILPTRRDRLMHMESADQGLKLRTCIPQLVPLVSPCLARSMAFLTMAIRRKLQLLDQLPRQSPLQR